MGRISRFFIRLRKDPSLCYRDDGLRQTLSPPLYQGDLSACEPWVLLTAHCNKHEYEVRPSRPELIPGSSQGTVYTCLRYAFKERYSLKPSAEQCLRAVDPAPHPASQPSGPHLRPSMSNIVESSSAMFMESANFFATFRM